MAKGIGHFILIIKAILTRIIFGAHGFVAIWRVTSIKNDPYYWYLCASILALGFEGVFTLTIKENQEWKWFCPSVFLYLCGVVPAIWLIEVDKFDRKLAIKIQAEQNLTVVKLKNEELAAIDTFGVELKIPVELDGETWAMVIEQLLMLILIIGRWLLPKGELTRDQLSQLLLVYIGTAADIIEFFDTFKDEKISSQRVLCLLILSIWSWSLLQFTFVLTATKSRRMRITADIEPPKPKFVNGIYKVKEVCCSIDVWGILINIILQDAPFLIFRALLIFYYKIINYMNIFFTAKNTLVIILQFYRLYIVQQEKNKEISKLTKTTARAVAAESKQISANSINKNTRPVPNIKGSTGGKSGGSQAASKGKRKKVGRSQDSITSGNKMTSVASVSKEMSGRPEGITDPEDLNDGVADTYEDDLEMGMSASVLSGEMNEAETPHDDLSVVSEEPNTREIKLRNAHQIYKISGSRSSGVGVANVPSIYSTSSQEETGSSNRGSRVGNDKKETGRAKTRGGGRSKSAKNRRKQLARADEEDYDSFEDDLEMESSSVSSDENDEIAEIITPESENERIFQRRAAICVVFSIFTVMFILCMVAIYGGINPKGLVLRETFRIVNSTKPHTTMIPNMTSTPVPTLSVVPLVSLDPDEVSSSSTDNHTDLENILISTTQLISLSTPSDFNGTINFVDQYLNISDPDSSSVSPINDWNTSEIVTS